VAADPAHNPRGRPVWVAFTLGDRLRRRVEVDELAAAARSAAAPRAVLRSGERLAAAVAAATAVGATALLVNCCRPEVATAALGELRALAPRGLALGAYANVFEGVPAAWDLETSPLLARRADLGPQRYAACARAWVAAGASLVGGCCGIAPRHIRAVGEALALVASSPPQPPAPPLPVHLVLRAVLPYALRWLPPGVCRGAEAVRAEHRARMCRRLQRWFRDQCQGGAARPYGAFAFAAPGPGVSMALLVYHATSDDNDATRDDDAPGADTTSDDAAGALAHDCVCTCVITGQQFHGSNARAHVRRSIAAEVLRGRMVNLLRTGYAERPPALRRLPEAEWRRQQRFARRRLRPALARGGGGGGGGTATTTTGTACRWPACSEGGASA
jgi:hypothetical protein